jgi:hypothetical protein
MLVNECWSCGSSSRAHASKHEALRTNTSTTKKKKKEKKVNEHV